MNSSNLAVSTEVVEMADWLAQRLVKMSVKLDFPHSPFVPGGVQAETTFAELPGHYRWRLSGMARGDWPETARSLKTLALGLREAVNSGSAAKTRAACDAVARVGADRNARVGAMAFLESLGEELPAYLDRVGGALNLSTAPLASDSKDLKDCFREVRRMNSMLSKIHALHAADGLPIYESRIAAGAAALVEMWRIEAGLTRTPLPSGLHFPAVGNLPQRRVQYVFPRAVDPGVLSYAESSEAATSELWCQASVKLGMLMRETLRRADDDVFVVAPERPTARSPIARMAAFTGALFVAGYDPVCLRSAVSVR